MPYDPNFPTPNTLADANAMRGQLNALNALIAAGTLAGVVIDGIVTLNPGEPATVEASLVAGVLHLSFGIPRGNDGGQGPQGDTGAAGEVTNAALDAAIAGTARNPVAVALLSLTVSDPPTQSELQQVVDKINELITAIFRAPV
ncbi:MAG: hypothetical protein ABMA13_10515 [Chthoniobacteraceae bacterium]